jgi:hypothetical protein
MLSKKNCLCGGVGGHKSSIETSGWDELKKIKDH